MSERLKLNPLIPELMCTDAKKSIAFYTDVLGFTILYQREKEGFAMLERQGSQIMLDEWDRNNKRSWFAGPLEAPFGRGMNLEMGTDDVDSLYARVQKSGATMFLPIEEKWYRADDMYLGCRQFIVLDPDGYLLRFAQSLGTRTEPPK